MNDFIKLNDVGNEGKLCVRKKDISKFEEVIFDENTKPKKGTIIFLNDGESWAKVKETVDEIFWMLEDRDSYE